MYTSMYFKNKNQHGFLLISAIILIFIFSVVGSILTYGYMKKGVAVAEDHNAQQALYIATSGLEIARRLLYNESLTCSQITGAAQLTNASLLGGRFTVTGTQTVVTNSLSSSITSSSSALTLGNAASFADEGVVKIDNEFIGYYTKTGSTLNNLKRGLDGTTAASHNASAVVSQDDCLLISKGAVPDLTSTSAIKTVQEVNSSNALGGGTFGADTPVLMTGEKFDLNGSATIFNAGVTLTNPHYAGSTIRSGGDVDLKGSAQTFVSNGAGGWTLSSTQSNLQPDIEEYDANVTSANLYTYYFDEPLTTIYSIADHSYDKNNLSGVAGKTVWIDGDLKITGNNTYNIGTISQPVVLIVDGDFDQAGSTTINLYGLMYIIGDIKINGSAAVNGRGALAAEGEAKVTGSMSTTLNPSAVGDLSLVNPYMNEQVTYSPHLFRRVIT